MQLLPTTKPCMLVKSCCLIIIIIIIFNSFSVPICFPSSRSQDSAGDYLSSDWVKAGWHARQVAGPHRDKFIFYVSYHNWWESNSFLFFFLVIAVALFQEHWSLCHNLACTVCQTHTHVAHTNCVSLVGKGTNWYTVVTPFDPRGVTHCKALQFPLFRGFQESVLEQSRCKAGRVRSLTW